MSKLVCYCVTVRQSYHFCKSVDDSVADKAKTDASANEALKEDIRNEILEGLDPDIIINPGKDWELLVEDVVDEEEEE